MEQHQVNYDRLFFGLIALAFYVFVFFPYFAIVPLGSDTQPNAVVAALLIILLANRGLSLPSSCWALGLLVVIAVLMLLLSPTSFPAQRSVFGYFSLFIVSTATYLAVRNGFTVSEGFLTFVILAWLFVGLVQLLVNPTFGTALLADARTSETRGVVSLAVEPGYYASMIYFIFLLLMAKKREISFLGLLCVGQIFLLAQSTVVIVALAISSVFYLLLKFRRLFTSVYFFGFLVLLFFLFPIVQDYLEGSRFSSLLTLVLDNPKLLFLADRSASSRASAILLSFSGAIDNYLVPWGYTAYSDYVASVAREYGNLFMNTGGGERIMSGYGAALFELGIFGLTIPIVITVAIFKRFGKTDLMHALSMSIATHTVLVTAVPLALPIIGLLIGYLLAAPKEEAARTRQPRRWRRLLPPSAAEIVRE